MKKHQLRCKNSQFTDEEDREAQYEAEPRGRSSDRQARRKVLQFCRQVQRALNLALADGLAGEGLFVDEVSPAPDSGRLLAHVLIPAGLPVGDAIAALRRAAPRLRSEVAATVNRKRAPELDFAPAIPEGGEDE